MLSGLRSMNDARVMSFRETFRHVLQHAQQFRKLFVFVADLVAQRYAIDVLHGDEVEAVCFANLVDVRDVWMVERRGRGRFLFEAAHPILV